MSQKILLTSKEVNIILHRLACQLIEKHLDFSDTILIGIQPRGTFLAERLKDLLEKEYKIPQNQQTIGSQQNPNRFYHRK
jgi:pyrimidine operon attenuation protein / uracil phosphoribosyltransferase